MDAAANDACLAAALADARAGIAVFPAPRGYKMYYRAARFCGGRRWGATKDADEIRRDWSRWLDANVCIVTGANIRSSEASTRSADGSPVIS